MSNNLRGIIFSHNWLFLCWKLLNKCHSFLWLNDTSLLIQYAYSFSLLSFLQCFGAVQTLGVSWKGGHQCRRARVPSPAHTEQRDSFQLCSNCWAMWGGRVSKPRKITYHRNKVQFALLFSSVREDEHKGVLLWKATWYCESILGDHSQVIIY